MACKDKERDKIILAEIARRKEQPDQSDFYQMHTFTGDLTMIHYMGIDEQKIVRIEQSVPGTWNVIYKK